MNRKREFSNKMLATILFATFFAVAAAVTWEYAFPQISPERIAGEFHLIFPVVGFVSSFIISKDISKGALILWLVGILCGILGWLIYGLMVIYI
jgi:heme A synthase